MAKNDHYMAIIIWFIMVDDDHYLAGGWFDQ